MLGRLPARARPRSLPVITVLSYGAVMTPTIRGRSDSSQSSFDADLIEALAACAELINTGRTADGDSIGDRDAFHGRAAVSRDVARLHAHRARLDAVAVACEAGDDEAAIAMLNALLAETGAVPQIVAHDGRGPHVHVSRPAD